MRLRGTALGLVVILGWGTLAALTATPARAQEDERTRARTAFEHGVERYQAHEYQSALESFQEAYRLRPHPTVRVNMANCYDRLGRPMEAMFHFERYLAESGSDAPPGQRREVEAALRRLRGRVGEVAVTVTPDNAHIRIDGADERVGPFIEPIRLMPGRHTIAAGGVAGYTTAERAVDVEAGERAEVTLTLERSAGGAPAAGGTGPQPAAQPAAGEADATSAPMVDGSGEPSDTGGGGGMTITTPVWIAGALTLALGAGAAVTGILALGANSDFEDAVVESNDPMRSLEQREASARRGHDAAADASTFATVTDVLLAGAVVGAAVTIVLLVTSGDDGASSDDSMASRLRWIASPAMSPDGGGVIVRGAF